MNILLSPSDEPAYNLALEELLLRGTDDVALLYINRDSVVCGKHQVLMAEIDPWYCLMNDIPLHRRLSGGGTVFHGPGNLNFSFILSRDEGTQVDFEGYVQPIVAFLRQKCGLDARFGGHNDIRVGELKISGNAEHVYKNRVIHHGTLLFDANLPRLKAAISNNEHLYTGHRVKSVPSKVGNIREMLGELMSMEDFTGALLSFLADWYSTSESKKFEELVNPPEVYKLARSKYSKDEWNFGHSPDYHFCKEVGEDRISIKVSRGMISEANYHSGRRDMRCIQFQQQLVGRWHRPQLVDELYKPDSCLAKEELRNLLF